MRKSRRVFALLLTAILAFTCFTPDSSGVNLQNEQGSYPTFYEIFVYSYCDSDGDGVGDLNGITSKLDYLQELGVGGIWLTPIHPATTYHKYDVMDYYDIDPQFGTLEDFDNFMAACRERGISVILDLVLNHSSSMHPWFQEAKTYLESLEPGQEPDTSVCPYVDFYHFTQNPPDPTYYPLTGEQWYYEGGFWSEMPDLNLDSPELRAEIRNIMGFWMERGVSGFRLDAAKEYVSGNTQKNVEILKFITDTAKELNPLRNTMKAAFPACLISPLQIPAARFLLCCGRRTTRKPSALLPRRRKRPTPPMQNTIPRLWMRPSFPTTTPAELRAL